MNRFTSVSYFGFYFYGFRYYRSEAGIEFC